MSTDRSLEDAATAPIPVISGAPRWSDTFASLRIRNYRLYAIAQFIAYTSLWAMRVAVDWLVFELTDSVTAVGLTAALQFGPMLVLGPLGGVIADRFPKRRLLVTTQSATAVLSASLAVLALTGVVEVWHVYLTAFLLGCVAVVDSPARAVFVNEMVGHNRLSNAISINASIFHLGGLIGPAVSGILLVLVGAGWSIAANAIAALVCVATLLLLRRSELLPSLVAKREKGQIREGIRYIRAKPTIFWPIVMLGFVATFGMSLPVLLVAFADTIFVHGAAGYGLFSSAAAVGALFGALVTARRTSLRLRSIMLAAGVFGLALIASGSAPYLPLFLIGLATVGFVRLQFVMTAESIVQMSSNRTIRGRVMSVYAMVVLGGQGLGAPLMGFLAEEFGVRAAMIVSGVVPTLAAIVISVILARSGRLHLRVRFRRSAVPLQLSIEHRLR